MPILVVTPVAAEIITTAEAKTHLRVTSSADDTYIGTLITAAHTHLEGVDGWLGRCFTNTTLDLKLDGFPAGAIRLPLAPVSSVTHVKYYDTANVEQTWTSANYQTDLVTEPGRLEPVSGVSWPSTYDRLNAVSVRFVAGYGASGSAVPAAYKHAVKMLVAHWYENREAVLSGTISKPIEFAVEALLAPYRLWVPA